MKRILSAVAKKMANSVEWVKRLGKPIYFQFFQSRLQCNICDWHDNTFNSDGWHPFTVCPNCGSGVRQRLFWATLNQSPEFSIEKLLMNKKILHFAPDACLAPRIKKLAKEYITADLLTEGYDYPGIDLNIDMSDMKDVKDGEFDCIIAFDVLEHIPNHLEAIAEANRVLKPGGVCVFTVPQKDGLAITIEDVTETDPKKREERFGQADHFRIYGNDFQEMIEKKGFRVVVLDKSKFCSDNVKRNVLEPPVNSDHPLATNVRKVYFGQKI